MPAAASAATFAAAAFPARSATSRRDSSVFASLCLLLGSLAGFLFGASSSLFLFRLFACFLLGLATCLLCGLLLPLAAAVGFGESGTSVSFFVGLTGIVQGADAARLLFGG